jgi:hypothetical protein
MAQAEPEDTTKKLQSAKDRHRFVAGMGVREVANVRLWKAAVPRR